MEKQCKVKTTSAEELRQLEQTAVSPSSYRLSENPNVAGGNFQILYLGTVLPHVLCCFVGFFFLFKWSQLWSYSHFESAYHHSTWALYKKKKAVWHDRDLSLKNLLVFCCLFLISGVSTDKGWGKKQQMNSRKRSSCFQARFSSETKKTLRHPTSHEEQVGIFKATHEASFSGSAL